MRFTKSDHLKAEWALRVYEESKRDKTTARALHYFALGRQDYPIFNRAGLIGQRAYTDADAGNITEWIALAKRQGVIPWDLLPDDTVGEFGELVSWPSERDFSYDHSKGTSQLNDLKYYLKRKKFSRNCRSVKRDQPYHLELWVEKSTMNNILRPVCSRFDTVLVTFKGHASWGATWKLCKRVAQDGRPALVFYLSDMDASGFKMAVEAAEKIREINTNFFDGRLDIKVRRIGLTPAQVVEYQIPMVDRKDGEKSNQELYRAYVSACGLDYTKKAELDALERYYPDGVAGFVESWLERFYDDSLGRRCQDATTDCEMSLPPIPMLPENVIEIRTKILEGLEELIAAEADIEIPAGDSVEVDIEPVTEDPDDLAWLMDTLNEVYPGEDDVDFVGEVG